MSFSETHLHQDKTESKWRRHPRRHFHPLLNKEDRKQITAAPWLATADQLKGLPPALVMTDECDVLRDEGEEYAKKLSLAGVEVTAVRFLATFHDFMMLNGLAETSASKSAIELASQKLSAILAQQKTSRISLG